MSRTISRRKILLSATLGSQLIVEQAVAGSSGYVSGVQSSVVRPEEFGAVADGQTDCHAAFVSAIEVATRTRMISGRQRNLPIELSSGVYRLTGGLSIDAQDIAFQGPGAQLSALLLDHYDIGIKYTGGGDATFQGFTIESTTRRTASRLASPGILSDPGRIAVGGPKTTIRLTFRDIHIYDQPGDGLILINPEGARLENITAARNSGNGCLLFGRDVDNILNYLDFCRFRDNARHGLRVENLNCSIISRVECLNNFNETQMVVIGTHNRIESPDCECFEGKGRSEKPVGIEVRGNSNIVSGGVFYKLNTAILLKNAPYSRVILPKLEGSRSQYMMNGVVVDKLSIGCSIDVGHCNFVEVPVKNFSTRSNVRIRGYSELNADEISIVRPENANNEVSLDMNDGQVFEIQIERDTILNTPKNIVRGKSLTIIIRLVKKGARLLFSSGFSGVRDGVVSGSGVHALTFVALSSDELVMIGPG